MTIIEVIMVVEGDPYVIDYDEDELVEAISCHRDVLRSLQGFWGRLIENWESEGII